MRPLIVPGPSRPSVRAFGPALTGPAHDQRRKAERSDSHENNRRKVHPSCPALARSFPRIEPHRPCRGPVLHLAVSVLLRPSLRGRNFPLDIGEHLRYYDRAEPVPGAHDALHPWRGVRGRSGSPAERLGFFFCPAPSVVLSLTFPPPCATLNVGFTNMKL